MRAQASAGKLHDTTLARVHIDLLSVCTILCQDLASSIQVSSTPRCSGLLHPFTGRAIKALVLPHANPKKRKAQDDSYLDGQLLIAMPIMSDKRFARSVIYLCAHSAEGAMGLIINQRAPHISFPELLGQLSIGTDNDSDESDL